jgi:epoxide hydrolase 4
MAEHHFIQTNGVTLHVVTAGPPEGEPVILLHGFPEFWYGWRHQIPFLAQQGFRVIVPDQRGYNLSDKPRGREAYHLDHLARDVVGLIDALGYERVCLAGHDWGAGVAWWMATHFAERLRRLAILNVPYPTLVMQAAQLGYPEQLSRSWYAGFFQLPWLPENLLRRTIGTPYNMMRLSSRRDTFSEADIAAYERAWLRPGALRAMLNWYRAALPALVNAPTPPTSSLPTPTLMLWGERDVALLKELASLSIELCAEGELIFFPKATHWVQHDEATAVNEHLARFFGGKETGD